MIKRIAACLGGLVIASALSASNVAAEDAAPAQSLASVGGIARTLNPTDGTHTVHIFPTTALHQQLKAQSTAGTSNLTYHAGGSIMPVTNFYVIFWMPAKLQNGATVTPLTAFEQTRIKQMVSLYPHHALNVINTQYYQTINGATTYIGGNGGFITSYTDTAAFPARTCGDTATPGNCITNTQIFQEIDRVRQLNKWPTGLGTMYLLFTPNGMGSCFDNTNKACAYTQYCAYHSYYNIGNQQVVYSNQPWGRANGCWDGGPSPNNDIPLDSTLDTASHEISESITDPLLNAWFDSNDGSENGDKCNFNFGTLTWDAAKANQMWSGVFFRLQQEWSNHSTQCLQAGP